MDYFGPKRSADVINDGLPLLADPPSDKHRFPKGSIEVSPPSDTYMFLKGTIVVSSPSFSEEGFSDWIMNECYGNVR